MTGPFETLQRILEALSCQDGGSDALAGVRNHIAYESDIHGLSVMEFRIIAWFTIDRYAKFSVSITQGDENRLYLAILTLAEEKWTLIALMRRCHVCKGSQREDDWNPCTHCCASGWGNEDIWRDRFFAFWS